MQSIPQSFAADGAEFIEKTCLPFLRNTQNSDGGWGFSAESESRVEPTAWGLLALREFSPSFQTAETDLAERIERAIRFLHSTQLADGSWASAPDQHEGTWVTALACWALKAADDPQQQAARGLIWLTRERPGDSGRWWRLLRRIASNKSLVKQSDAYFGWSWTHGTASWVEPTSYALLALRHLPAEHLTSQLQERLQLAEAMLLDRMCPGGGWNCGNPMVYGVPGQAQIGPTVWALLALRGSPRYEEGRESLEWLAKNWNTVSSPGSLALAQIGLQAYRQANFMILDALRGAYSSDNLLWSVPAVAWSALAMCTTQNWLGSSALPECA